MGNAEHEAIAQVLSGDRDAFRVLVDAHYQFAFRVACRITGDASDAEEVAQEAFFRAYNKLSTFRHDAKFSTWVNRIVINTAINLVERRKRDLLHAADGIGEPEALENRHRAVQIADAHAGPERLLLDKEAMTLRHSAMASLTPMERTAFMLRHMEDLPIGEIAAALQVPQNSAKQAVFRAVAKLRRSLAPGYIPSGGGTR